ncbi:Uncharacterized conserved protein YjgD, DUF1641 family [Thalassobacillus cyri]|uniref:Uncharacterized conserved protein YjgD, DUF1641 family n=1 Tax=Thalassobacillus cyri TaxID=571932 RepID=A0A1H3Z7G9_9BACI|nr:DUF1641 domain-containing protein [Thalassobacillus cyri]SEA19324.1 Uncharacterized conserved protein YjgD, DUF1641 family [Thalassobacillus cyri]
MTTTVTEPRAETKVKLESFTEAAMQAVTAEMVTGIAEKVVEMIEVADDVLQPETIDLLRVLPQVSGNLQQTLMEVKKLEESGTLKTLVEAAELVQSMKSAVTGPMISDMMDKAIKGIELGDELVQKGAVELADGMVGAFDRAVQEQADEEPPSMVQLIRMMNDKETRKGLSLMLSFVKKLPNELYK